MAQEGEPLEKARIEAFCKISSLRKIKHATLWPNLVFDYTDLLTLGPVNVKVVFFHDLLF